MRWDLHPKREDTAEVEAEMERDLGADLSQQHIYEYREFSEKCDRITGCISRVFGDDFSSAQVYSGNLVDFRQAYISYLRAIEMLEDQIRNNDDRKIRDGIETIDAQLKQSDVSDAVKASLKQTQDTLQKRLESHVKQRDRLQLAKSELIRLTQSVELLADQVVLTSDQSSLSQKMDQASGILEEHTKWLQDNSEIMQTQTLITNG